MGSAERSIGRMEDGRSAEDQKMETKIRARERVSGALTPPLQATSSLLPVSLVLPLLRPRGMSIAIQIPSIELFQTLGSGEDDGPYASVNDSVVVRL